MIRDVRRYEHVLNLARSHDSGGKFSMACSVYKGKKLLYVGYNEYPSSRGGESINKGYTGLGVHAELSVVHYVLSRELDPKKLSLYVAGVNPNGTALLSKACPRCNNLILLHGYKAITYFDGYRITTDHIRTLEPLVVPIYNERKLLC